MGSALTVCFPVVAGRVDPWSRPLALLFSAAAGFFTVLAVAALGVSWHRRAVSPSLSEAAALVGVTMGLVAPALLVTLVVTWVVDG